MTTLIGMHSALKTGEASVEEMFPIAKVAGDKPADLKGRLDELAGGDEKDQKKAEPEGKTKKSEPAPASEGEQGNPPAEPAEKPSSGQTSSRDPGDGDPIAEARRRGAEMRDKKMSRKALPPEYQKDADLRDAWLLGFDTGSAEREPGEEG